MGNEILACMIKTTFKILGIFCLFSGCSGDEDVISLNIDFGIALSSDVAPSELTVINRTTGAMSYQWTFADGIPETSTEKNPAKVLYTRAGEHTIILEASNGAETNSVTKTFTLQTHEIIAYRNIKLGGIKLEASLGCLFSTSSGRVINSTELSEKKRGKHRYCLCRDSWCTLFESPETVGSWGLSEIPNATSTAFINYLEGSGIDFPIETFDNMIDDTPLRDLNIVSDFQPFYTNGILPKIVLFKNSRGKAGAIKVTEVVFGLAESSITFDLKIQK